MYEYVAVMSVEGKFIGYAIKDPAALKLQSTNLYGEDEGADLEKRLRELNRSSDLMSVWPDAHDPDVQRILNKADFEPLEMKETQVVDEDNSYVVWVKDPVTGEDSEDLDEEASVIKYKTILAPVRPSDVFERTKKACEIVAKQRLTAR